MFRVILETQWRWTRGVLLVGTCLSFALPFMSLRSAARALDEMNASVLLVSMEQFGAIYAIAAAMLGMVIAGMAWSPDHTGRHVYALSLPIERWRYVAMRFGAGALTLTPLALALWLGGIVALLSINIPDGLHAHPAALAIRFALAMLVAYAIFFAISSGTKRTTMVLLGILLATVLVDVLADVMGVPIAPFSAIIDLLIDWTGTLGVFNGRWMLIDV